MSLCSLRHRGRTGAVDGAVLHDGMVEMGERGGCGELMADTTYSWVFSERADGFAHTTPQFLTDAGWVVGQYLRFDGNGSGIWGAFLWSVPNGFTDLGALVEGGVPEDVWQSLMLVSGFDGVDSLVGFGKLNAGGYGAFAMSVPSPGVFAIFGIAISGAGGRRRVV